MGEPSGREERGSERAGCAAEGSAAGSKGDSGSHAGDGGVAARAGDCLYCALKDVSLFIVVVCADGGAEVLGLASQKELWGGSAKQLCERSGRGHVLVRGGERRDGDERVSGGQWASWRRRTRRRWCRPRWV
jgi:hypothetical protein